MFFSIIMLIWGITQITLGLVMDNPDFITQGNIWLVGAMLYNRIPV